MAMRDDMERPPIAVSAVLEDMQRSHSSGLLPKRSAGGNMRRSVSSVQLPPMSMGRSSSVAHKQHPSFSSGTFGRQAFVGGIEDGADAPSASPPAMASTMPPRPVPLKKMYTGVGLAAACSRGNIFDSASKVTLSLSASNQKRLTDEALRAQRAQRQRAERSERPIKKRGAHAHLPLQTEMQPWAATAIPSKTVMAADRFDSTHRQRWDSGENLYFSISRDLTHQAKQDAFSVATMELAMNRFHIPTDLGGVQRFEMRHKKAKPKKPWKLEESIWAPRVKWCDSKDFWDTDECENKMFDNDWEKCLQCGLGRYIMRLDDADDATDDAEVEEVAKVMWEYHDLVNVIFDYYAAMGASDDVTHIGPNAFSQFANDCQLIDKHSEWCKATAFDQLFIAVDASSAGGKTSERFNRKKALNRQEFVQCLVKIACMRYVMNGTIVDVSEAVYRMFSSDIEPRLDKKVFAEPNDYRTRFCYVETTDQVLRRYEPTLRLIWARACVLDGQNAAKGVANKMVSYESWKDLCRMFELVSDGDVTERDVTLSFIMSRMRVIDEQKDRSRIILTHLAFEDFLEALCRLCVRKVVPTPDDIKKLNERLDDETPPVENAGQFILKMRDAEPDAYDNLIQARCRPWGTEPSMPFAVCLESLISLLIVTCQMGLNGTEQGDGKALTEKQVNAFMKVSATN